MAKTIKGLTTAAKKARARFIAWQSRYEDLLSNVWLVNGNPAREWIVGRSWTLADEYGEDDYYWAEAVDSTAINDGDWLIDVDCRWSLSVTLANEGTRLWKKVRKGGLCGYPWYAGCTAYVLHRMKRIERRMQYWQVKMEAAENALDDLLNDY